MRLQALQIFPRWKAATSPPCLHGVAAGTRKTHDGLDWKLKKVCGNLFLCSGLCYLVYGTRLVYVLRTPRPYCRLAR
jgi:hypothetical protein